MNNFNKPDEMWPKVSIVVPTRERSATLMHTLKTCVNQSYKNIEIIICDNYSQDATEQVVKSNGDTRVRYINTGKRISMSHNWEFALDYVTGDYVTYIGDDDAFLPDSINSMVNIIKNTGVEALTWRWASYYWPDCIDNNSKNLLVIPFGGSIENRLTSDYLPRVLNHELGYEQLPFLYKGIVSMRAIMDVREKSNGVFFHSINPDLYSAIAISCVVDKYIYSHEPFSMNGTSGHSNGASFFKEGLDGGAVKKFFSEDNIPFHPDLDLCPSVPIMVTECRLKAQMFFSQLADYKFDLKKVIEAAHTDVLKLNGGRFESVKSAILATAERHGLRDYAEMVFSKKPKEASNTSKPVGLTPGVNFYHKQVILDCEKHGISNIHTASILCGLIVKKNQFYLTWSMLDVIKSTLRILVLLTKRTLNFGMHTS